MLVDHCLNMKTLYAQVFSQVLYEVQSELPQERRKSTGHAQISGKYQTQAGARCHGNR